MLELVLFRASYSSSVLRNATTGIKRLGRQYLAQHPIPAPDALLPPGHSLVFFHPHTSEAELAPDQTSDAELGPPKESGFTRRMWASGGFTWNIGSGGSPSSGLKMGRDALAKARVVRVERKGFEKGNPMVFVHQEIEYGHGVPSERTDALPAITERRVHVYLSGFEDNNTLRRSKPRTVPHLPLRPSYSFSWTPTATTLFRFSALTFNGHLIHLDKEYSQNVEGYPERLVHGPLTSLMLLEAFQHMTRYGGNIVGFEYRAQNPVIVGRVQHILGDYDETGQKFTIWAQDNDGVVGMTSIISLRGK